MTHTLDDYYDDDDNNKTDKTHNVAHTYGCGTARNFKNLVLPSITTTTASSAVYYTGFDYAQYSKSPAYNEPYKRPDKMVHATKPDHVAQILSTYLDVINMISKTQNKDISVTYNTVNIDEARRIIWNEVVNQAELVKNMNRNILNKTNQMNKELSVMESDMKRFKATSAQLLKELQESKLKIEELKKKIQHKDLPSSPETRTQVKKCPAGIKNCPCANKR